LAARRVGWHTVWYSEIDPFACRVMERRFPEARNYGDIRSIEGSDVAAVDVLCGGFPCQDISQAQAQSGDGIGLAGAHSGLWSEFSRLVGELQPAWVVIENVPMLRRRGLGRVLRDLASFGYDATWTTVAAGAVGAPHKRARLWVVAYPHDQSEPDLSFNAETPIVPELRSDVRPWTDPPRGLRVVDGIPDRVDRLRALGNALVPQVAELVFRAIDAADPQQETS